MSSQAPSLTNTQSRNAKMAPTSSTIATENGALTAAQTQFLDEQGYLSVNAITTPEEAREIRAILQELFDRRAGANEGANVDLVAGEDPQTPKTAPQILNPSNYNAKLRKTACFKNALKFAQQILGEEARCFFDLSILKLAEVGSATPWHQDMASRDPRFEYTEINVWVALQDVAADGGCLQFIPGSHRLPVLQHHSVNDDPTAHSYECVGGFDPSKAVACPLPAGGCVIHLPRTLHCAGPNLVATPRVAYIMVFGLPPQPTKEPRVFPWLQQKHTKSQDMKRQWMRRGGLFVTLWRRVRQGDFSNWRTTIYGLKRATRILRRGE